MPHHYETVPDKELSNAERVELPRPSSRLDPLDSQRTLRRIRRDEAKSSSFSLSDTFSAVSPPRKKKILQRRTRSLSSARSLVSSPVGKVLVLDTQETTVPSTQPDEGQALGPNSPPLSSDASGAHLTPRATPSANALGLSNTQVSNDTIEDYPGTPPGLAPATSSQDSNPPVEGYLGTPEPAFTSAQIPRVHSAAHSPMTSPQVPQPYALHGFTAGIYGEPPVPPLDPSTAHPLHAHTAGAPDIDWPSTQVGKIREVFKLFDIDPNDESTATEQLKMNNSVIRSLNNVIRNCENSAQTFSSDLILGFLLNAIYTSYEAGSMMLGWDQNAVARQISFHANQTEVFQARATRKFDPSGNHADDFGSYHTTTIPPYSHDTLEREHGVTLFRDQEGNSVCGFDDRIDDHMSNNSSVGTEVSDEVMERAKEGLKDSIHANPVIPESVSRASSLPLANDFCEMILKRVQFLENFVGIPGKGKGRHVPDPVPAPAPNPTPAPARTSLVSQLSRRDLLPAAPACSYTFVPDSPESVLPPLPDPLPRIDDSTSFPSLLPAGPPDVKEFTPTLTKNQKKAAKRAEKKKTMAETVVAALEAGSARVPPAPKPSKTPHASSSRITPATVTPHFTAPSTDSSKNHDLSVVARFHTKITQEGVHKLPPRLVKERVDAFFKGRVGTGKLRLSTAYWNGAGNLVMNFPPSTDASLIFNKEDELKTALKLPGPATFQRNAPWKKVMINGVCTGMNRDGTGSVFTAARLTEELREAHPVFRNMKFTQEPRFLATRETLAGSEHRSVLICFEDNTGSVWQSLRSIHFNMFAKPVSFREFNDKQVLRVCLKCHSYDHEGTTCKATAICAICSGAHPESQHKKHCNRKTDSCKGTLAAAPVTHAKTCGACKRLNDKDVRWDHAFDSPNCPSKAGYRVPASRVLRSHAPSHMIPSHPAVPNADEPSAFAIFAPVAPTLDNVVPHDTVMTNPGPGEAIAAVAE
ncbi:hypothetical protein BDV93DRAFT_559144 [Ceratobasidium sp. AG-I]|nr:hypothetical protein BDV93DRAFT_559144 [Ceratobasidium sp. AG-I]